MADVQPFRGLRYNIERIGNLSSVVSPPYDVISPQEQQLYLGQSPYNVIRLELGEEKTSDSPENNKYIRAANTLKKWLEEGILFRDEWPAFYIFEHRFTYQGAARHRWGLTTRVRLEDWSTGRIHPHENTLEDRIWDRPALLRSCPPIPRPIRAMFRH